MNLKDVLKLDMSGSMLGVGKREIKGFSLSN